MAGLWACCFGHHGQREAGNCSPSAIDRCSSSVPDASQYQESTSQEYVVRTDSANLKTEDDGLLCSVLSRACKLVETVSAGFKERTSPFQKLRRGLTQIASSCAASFACVHVLPPTEECFDGGLPHYKNWRINTLQKMAHQQASDFTVQLCKPLDCDSLAERLVSNDLESAVWSLSSGPAVKECSYFDSRTGPKVIVAVSIKHLDRRVGVLCVGFEASNCVLSLDAWQGILKVAAAMLGPVLEDTFFSCLRALLNFMAGNCSCSLPRSPHTINMLAQKVISSLPDLAGLPLPPATPSLSAAPGFAWYRLALLDKSRQSVTLLEDITQVPCLRESYSAMIDSSWSSHSPHEPAIRRNIIPYESTLVKMACNKGQQVLVRQLQKLLTQDSAVHLDVLVRYTGRPADSTLIMPLMHNGQPYGAIVALFTGSCDLDIAPAQLHEATELLSTHLYKALTSAEDYLSIASPASDQLLNHSLSRRRSLEVSSEALMFVPSTSLHASTSAGQPSSSVAASTRKGSEKETYPGSTLNMSSMSSSSEMLACSHSMGVTDALVVGLTRSLNDKRMSWCSQAADAQRPSQDSISQLKLVRVLGKGGFASVFEAKWRGLNVAAKIVVDNGRSGKLSLKHAHEIALLMSLSHPGVLQAYCCLTDVLLEELMVFCVGNGTGTGAVLSALRRLNQVPHSTCHVQVVELCDLLCMSGFPQCHCSPRDTLLRDVTSKPHAQPQRLRTIMTMCDSSQPGGACGPKQLLISLRRLCLTLTEVTSSLAYLHRMGVVHCDIKPANLLMKTSSTDPQRGFTVKIGDFGLSRVSGEEQSSEDADGGVRPGMISVNSCGSLSYVAPEALHAGQKVDSTVDVYSLGIVMWQMFTLQHPYRGMSQDDILDRVTLCGMRPAFPAAAPRPYQQLAEMCWAHKPTARPSCSDIICRLQAMLASIEDGSLEDLHEFSFKPSEPRVQYIIKPPYVL